MTAVIGQVWCVFKMRIAVAIMLSALAGLAVMPGPALSAWQVAVLALSVLLSAASAGAFNQFIERDLDRRMARTAGRPFASGAWRAGPLWLSVILALLAAAVAAAAWVLNGWVALHVFLGAFVYGVVYTVWLKRRTWLNIVLGGLAGSFAVLAGAAAVDPALAPAPIILAVVLFLWTPPHFWSLATVLRADYARAGVPMLPVVIGDGPAAWVILAHAVALVALSLMPVAFGMGWIYFVAAALGGAWFVHRSICLVRAPDARTAMTNFFASLIQLGALLSGAIADRLILG
ncbi:MAG: protoheme IX farnesyltransferase [Alphaproteobacteria bacterium]|nr:MAG: protoheme IX farnesyltransferase [Alphaproteobacteria bacterium]